MKRVLASLLLAARHSWKGMTAAVGVLFWPIKVLAAPLIRLWPRRWFNKRASAWSSAPMQGSSQSLDAALFKPGNMLRSAPQIILRPVSPPYVLFTLLAALLLNLLPWGSWHWAPDWLALTLLFWVSREPRLIGFGTAFIFGMFMDVHDGTVMGEHSLSYVLLAYAASVLSRRLPSFELNAQALQVWPVLLVTQVLTLSVRVFFGGHFPGWVPTLIAPTIAACLWPFITWVLLAPQRKPLDVDENRPL